jgi:putative FmdB family regulatory protein
MPIYEYECNKCRKIIEKLEKMSNESCEKCCPVCSGNMKRIMSRNTFHLKDLGGTPQITKISKREL